MHLNAVSEHLLGLLKALMALPETRAFRLVGGTALALHLGHRRSDDIDLFTVEAFDAEALAETVGLRDRRVQPHSATGTIDGIKVDLLAHRYAWLDPEVVAGGVRLASLRDIAAMKLNAIANRGSKKDFWDVAALLRTQPIERLLACYRCRYPQMDDGQVMRSLVYFDDAEDDPDPVALDATTWAMVKDDICARALIW